MNESQNRFGGLPVYSSSWDPEHLGFAPEADFQAGIEELVLQGELEEPLDEAMGGHPSPRVWLFLHEPGQGPLSAVAALYFGRELALRDQGVLVLDCDEEACTLTRWAGRAGAEGWADLVRYGASVLTCGIPLPFPGRRSYLLGPGSYTPVDVQPAEIQQALLRLRRQADDIVLVCADNEKGRLWAAAADIRMLCWNADATGEGRLESILADFARGDVPLSGLVRFGTGSEAEAAAAERAADPAARVPAGPGQGASEASARGTAAGWPGSPDPEDLPPPVAFARKRGTSRVFWWTALAAVALIAMSGWYYLEYVVVSPSEGPAVRPDGRISPQGQVEPPAAQGIEPDGRPVGPDASAEVPVTVPAAPRTETPAETSGVTSGETPGEAPAEIPAGTGQETPAQETKAPGFFMDPYLVAVGSDGWALHVYSFPDQGSTDLQLEILHRKGFTTATRTVQIKDKGRWHRIYLGSFPTRAEAQEALDPLLRELGEDWGRPTEF